MRVKYSALAYMAEGSAEARTPLVNTTSEGAQLDYAFRTQIGERRIQDLLDGQWEDFARLGPRLTGRNYIIEFSFEG